MGVVVFEVVVELLLGWDAFAFAARGLIVMEVAGDIGVWKDALGFVEDVFFEIATGDVGENEVFDVGLFGKGGGLGGCEMGELLGHVLIGVHIGGFGDESVDVLAIGEEGGGIAKIAGDGDAGAGDFFSEDILWLNDATVCEGDGVAIDELFADGAEGDAELFGFFGEEGAGGGFFE